MSRNFLLLLFTMAFATACDNQSKTEEFQALPSSPIDIIVDDSGYTPSKIEGSAGKPLRLSFKRITDKGCGEKLVFPELGIEKELPLGRQVEVSITPKRNVSIAFTCGMGMYQGSVVAVQ